MANDTTQPSVDPQRPAETKPAVPALQAFWNSPAPQRIAITVVMLVFYRLGLLIPPYHVSTTSLYLEGAGGPQNWPELLARVSYFAIGITPVISILIVAEIGKLAFSDVRDWSREPDTRTTFNRVLIVLALMLAALQGYGISVALEQANDAMPNSIHAFLRETGTGVRVSYVASAVAATILCVWLADQITRHGLGSGIWFIYLLGPVIGLASMPADLAGRIHMGELAPATVVFSAVLLIASAAAVATLTRLWLQWAEPNDALQSEERPDAVALSIMIWPPLLASSFAGIIYALIGGMTSFERTPGDPQLILTISVVVSLLIWLFTALMVRTFPRLRARDSTRTRVLLGLTILTAGVLCLIFDVVLPAFSMPVRMNAPAWIAIVAVLTTLLPRDIGTLSAGTLSAPPEFLTDKAFEAQE